MKSRKQIQLQPTIINTKQSQLTTTQIAQFLEDYRSLMMNNSKGKSKLISIKIPESLLNTFKLKCENKGIKYQTQIKALMKKWVE